MEYNKGLREFLLVSVKLFTNSPWAMNCSTSILPPFLVVPIYSVCASTTLSSILQNLQVDIVCCLEHVKFQVHQNQATHKKQTQTSTRAGCRWEVFNTAAWDPLMQAGYTSHQEIWGYSNHQDLFSLQDSRSLLVQISSLHWLCKGRGRRTHLAARSRKAGKNRGCVLLCSIQ